MSDVGFVEDLMNCEQFAVDSTVNNFSFAVPEIVVDLDRNESNSVDESVVNNSSVVEESRSVLDNSSVVEQSQTSVNNANVFEQVQNLANYTSVFEEGASVVNASNFVESESVLESSSLVEEVANFADNDTNVLNNDTNVLNETQSLESFVQNSTVLHENNVINVNAPPSAPPVTVNFNAYNEFGGGKTDVDSVMSAFCDRLSEAVAVAAEGVRF